MSLAVLSVLVAGTYWISFQTLRVKVENATQKSGEESFEQKLKLCNSFPNNSTQEVTETSRLFINIPRGIYPQQDNFMQFTTKSGNATAGLVSNGGIPGEGQGANSDCLSYYYEFDGNGEIDLNIKGIDKDPSDYSVRFNVKPN